MTKTLIAMCSACLLVLGACSSGAQGPEDNDQKLRIGYMAQIDVPAAKIMYKSFQKEFISRSGRSAGSIEWVEKSAHGDNSKCPQIARILANENLDAIAAQGTPCIIAIAAATKTVPIITLGIGDPVEVKVAKSLTKPGTNVTGAYQGSNAATPLENLLLVSPKPETLGFIYDQSNESIVKWASNLKAAADANGVKLIQKGITTVDQVAPTVRGLATRVDALFVGPDGTMSGAIPVVAASAAKSQIPLYLSGLSAAASTPGVAADIGLSYRDLGRTAGGIAVKILIDGDDPASTPFQKPPKMTWTINLQTLKELNLTVPVEIKNSAKVAKSHS